MTTATPADWARLRDRVERRMAVLGTNGPGVVEVARRGGHKLSINSMWNLMHREYTQLPTPSTLRAIEFALGWRTGSIQAVLRGEEPIQIESPAPLADRQVTVYLIGTDPRDASMRSAFDSYESARAAIWALKETPGPGQQELRIYSVLAVLQLSTIRQC